MDMKLSSEEPSDTYLRRKKTKSGGDITTGNYPDVLHLKSKIKQSSKV
jgi:hypothetical protein